MVFPVNATLIRLCTIRLNMEDIAMIARAIRKVRTVICAKWASIDVTCMMYAALIVNAIRSDQSRCSVIHSADVNASLAL